MTMFLVNKNGTVNKDLEKSIVVITTIKTQAQRVAYLESITEDNRFIFRIEDKPYPEIIGFGLLDPDSPNQEYIINTVDVLKTSELASTEDCIADGGED